MFKIPFSFSNENEGYITLPTMRKFAKEYKCENLSTTADRPTMISAIDTFANISNQNKEYVMNWVDASLKEGAKDIQVKLLDLVLSDIDRLKDEEYVQGLLEGILYNPQCKHFCENDFGKDIKLYRYEIENGNWGKVICLYLGKRLHFYDKLNGTRTAGYPMCVEIYVDKGYVATRAKSKAGMYKLMENTFVLEEAKSTNVEKEIKNSLAYVIELFGLVTKTSSDANGFFRNKLYIMLDRYTFTPKEIRDLMDSKSFESENVKKYIMGPICNLDESYESDVISDIKNMVEKYFSISYIDKGVFTRNRDAYPLKILATDEEESKVEQTSAEEEPLQSKAVFFDNKKMIQKSQLCDGVRFRFSRINTKYCSRCFDVKITIKGDACNFKFMEYTMEEDITHVLFSLIDT